MKWHSIALKVEQLYEQAAGKGGRSHDMRRALIAASAAVDGDRLMPDCGSKKGGPILRCGAEQRLLCAHGPFLHALHHGRWLALLQALVTCLVEELPGLFLACSCWV
jgi:hypothetical protein